jgi:hypothetical protein
VALQIDEGGARLFDIEPIVNWHEVRRTYQSIEHRAGDKVIRIGFTPRADPAPPGETDAEGVNPPNAS